MGENHFNKSVMLPLNLNKTVIEKYIFINVWLASSFCKNLQQGLNFSLILQLV